MNDKTISSDNTSSNNTRVFRYAPSPTGKMHLGQLKAVIIPYLLAKKHKGIFILRIEDTDLKRNRQEAVSSLLKDLKWLGIKYDQGPTNEMPNEYFQSQRLHIYNEYIQKLLDEGKAYYAYETPEERREQIKMQRAKGRPPVYSGAHANLTEEQRKAFEAQGRKPVVRIKVPRDQFIEFKDEVFGKIKISTNQIGDFVIRKSDGTPMYNFSVVIDDYLMKVTDVIRGFGHLSNTPKQVFIYDLLGWPRPKFAHFSDIQNENNTGKLSKRYGAKPIAQFRSEGYLPQALINYVISISCSFHFQNQKQEIMELEEIIDYIDYSKILKTNAKFNSQKLAWFNGQHIRRLTLQDFTEKYINWLTSYADELKFYHQEYFFNNKLDKLINQLINNRDLIIKVSPLLKERISKFMDSFEYLKFLFEEPQSIDISPCNHDEQEFQKAREALYELFKDMPEKFWSHQIWENKIRQLADKLKWKHADFFMALRLLITGSRYSLPLYETMVILGKKACLKRIKGI